jgi:alanyl-tRNA synthetase
VITQAKKLGKAAYVFSVDAEGGKVAHANYVPDSTRVRGLDARTWASKVAEIVGGKVVPHSFGASRVAQTLISYEQAGGREDSAQGVGPNIARMEEAFQVAKEQFGASSP